jgi:hypothetical protein
VSGSKRLDDLFHVLKVIRRIVDDADDDPPASTGTETEPRAPVAWTPGRNDVAAYAELLIDVSSSATGRQRLMTELRARVLEVAAHAREVAEGLRNAADLRELYLFCLVNIDDRETMVNTFVEALMAVYKLEAIKRALANVNIPPRTKSLGKAARGTDTPSPPASTIPPPRPIKAGLKRPPKGRA